MNQELGIKNEGLVLGLRTDSADSSVILSEGEGSVLDRKEWTSGRQLSDQLLSTIEEMLHKQKKDWKDLSGIVVYAGPGSFTGLRIGITVANTIAYVQKIKIVGETGDSWFEEGAKMLAAGQGGEIVVPEYGAEANITKPKK
jgi:tRNA threonylcarbamoyladenosine biosynthesis protein TsaB